MLFCSRCGTENALAAGPCRGCAAPLDQTAVLLVGAAAGAGGPAAAATWVPATLFCSRCGADNAATASACAGCATSLDLAAVVIVGAGPALAAPAPADAPSGPLAAALGAAPATPELPGALGRLDAGFAAVEKVVVLAFLCVMTGVVFFDVVHRVAATPDGFLLKLLQLAFGDPESPDRQAQLETLGVPLLARGLTFVVVYAAFRTGSGVEISRGRAAVLAVLVTAALADAVFLLLRIFPNGLVWSQPLALSLLLWVAMLGATLATRERGHIVLQIADRVWPPHLIPFARLGSGLVAAGFSAALVLLSWHYVADFHEQWRDGVGYVSGLEVPKWVVYSALPVSFTLMALRFFAYAIADFRRGRLPAGAGARS